MGYRKVSDGFAINGHKDYCIFSTCLFYLAYPLDLDGCCGWWEVGGVDFFQVHQIADSCNNIIGVIIIEKFVVVAQRMHA